MDTLGGLWDSANADPVGDVQRARDFYLDQYRRQLRRESAEGVILRATRALQGHTWAVASEDQAHEAMRGILEPLGWRHEVTIGKRCRVDFAIEATGGLHCIEVKWQGKCRAFWEQLDRYARQEGVQSVGLVWFRTFVPAGWRYGVDWFGQGDPAVLWQLRLPHHG